MLLEELGQRPSAKTYKGDILAMSSKKFKAGTSHIARLKLEAIFHPKFENETPAADVRRRMRARVAAGAGYLEASLKHSGSLVLWSGRQRFYSKNSTHNAFTHVGEILLRQHFARCYGSESGKGEYDRCSDFVHRNRLTCSFEVVTSALGHHGDLPKRDYLILIAVANRAAGRGVFYSTSELVRFSHQFRLPHNDAWIFTSSAACESLFRSYDAMRETGTATTVIQQFDQVVSESSEKGECAKFSSLYPHDVFQGEILEGIVIRYVPYAPRAAGEDDNDTSVKQESLDQMKELCKASIELLRLVPPSKTLDKQPVTPTLEKVDLRAFAAADDLEHQAEKVLRNLHGPNIRTIQCWNDSPEDGGEVMQTAATKCINVVNIAEQIMLSYSTKADRYYDRETLDIAQLILTVDELKIHASYKVLTEKTSQDDAERCLCIMHIHNDSSFPKYHSCLKQRGNNGMMLFRGFSIELLRTDDDHGNGNKTEEMDVHTPEVGNESNDTNEEKLMLKMKFVPYMVRTFICRNGLSLLQTSGTRAFLNHASNQLIKWRVSDACVRKWMPFFEGWASYSVLPPSKSLPWLSETSYIHHYNKYAELFANGEFQASTASFGGLIVIVGHSKVNMEALGTGVSKELHCSRIVHDVNQITEKDIVLSMSESGGGLVCIAEILDGYKNLRTLARKFHEAMFVIMVEGDSEDELGVSGTGSRKIKGMTQGWRKSKCNMLVDLPKEAAKQTNVDTTLRYLRTNDAAKATMDKLLKESPKTSPTDERPGLIVYFPSMPGSGKSSLCTYITTDILGMQGRKLVLMEGDRLKKGFYDAVQKELLMKPASVAILDKNVPPSSFSSIHTLCLESQSIAVPVIPAGMEDTRVSDGVTSHVYPFSLQHLAVCMSRVLRRKPKSHRGGLDSATATACMIVVKFYCFYRNMTSAVLKERLLKVGHPGREISVPFFKEQSPLGLPVELKSALEDAVMLQTLEGKKISKAGNEDMMKMEKRLRSLMQSHEHDIDNMTASLAESKKSFVSKLSKVIYSLPEKVESLDIADEPVAGTIKIASLDLNYTVVQAEIEKLRKSFPELDQYFAQRDKDRNNDENDKSQSRFIKSVHCTFAHFSQVTQAAMISTFQHLVGASISVKATSILFSDEIVAIELEMPNEASIPRPQTAFSHTTIWCAKDVEAYKSNDLPDMVKCNKARKVVFEQPIIMKGVFSFWHVK